MKILFAACAAALLACWAQTAIAISVDETAITADSLSRERAALQLAIAETQKSNLDAVALAKSLKAIISDAAFPALSDDERHMAYLVYGATLYDSEDWTSARDPLISASGMAEASAFDWGLRLSNDFRLRDFADAVPAATRIAKNWPDKLADYSDGGMFLLVREAKKQPPAIEIPFLEGLYAARWKPQSAFSTADSVWLALIEARLAQGNVNGARAIAMELRDPASIVVLHIEKSFDEIVSSDPKHFDVTAAYETSLADMKARSAADPDKLEGVNTVAEMLIVMTRYDEALALVSAALDRLKKNAKAFSDADDKSNWTEDIRSRALFNLRRNEEAFAALTAGAAQLEDGQINVSQAINLADNYNIFDRSQDALNAISKIDLPNASDYGRMALQDARVCAYFGLGDTVNMNKALDYMREHKRDGTQPYLDAMLFTGHTDEAAAEVIEQLRDPLRRAEILGYLQDYAPDPNPTKRSMAIHAAWIAIRNRPDVAAEIAKVGYINKYALHMPTY